MYISIVRLLVSDLDRAIEFYTKKLGWGKTMDEPMGSERWVTVAPNPTSPMFTLTVDVAHTGGASGVIMEVADVHQTYDDLRKAGVEFMETPRDEPWGGWAMFKDSEGNEHGMHSPVREPID